MFRDTEQFKNMSKLIPATRRGELLKGLAQIVDRYHPKPRHTGEKAAHKFDQALAKEIAAAAKSLVRFAETVDGMTGYAKEEFNACYIAACRKLNLKMDKAPSAAAMELLQASATVAAAINAYRLSRSVAHKSKHKPRLAQVAPTIELIGLWERLSGKKMTDPKSAGGRNGGGTNVNKDAEFVLQGLRLISPTLSESNGRTLIKNASKALKAQEETASALVKKLKSTGTSPSRAGMLSFIDLEIKKSRAQKQA